MKTWTGFVQGKYQYKGGNEGMQRAEKQDSDTRGMRIGAGTEKEYKASTDSRVGTNRRVWIKTWTEQNTRQVRIQGWERGQGLNKGQERETIQGRK